MSYSGFFQSGLLAGQREVTPQPSGPIPSSPVERRSATPTRASTLRTTPSVPRLKKRRSSMNINPGMASIKSPTQKAAKSFMSALLSPTRAAGGVDVSPGRGSSVHGGTATAGRGSSIHGGTATAGTSLMGRIRSASASGGSIALRPRRLLRRASATVPPAPPPMAPLPPLPKSNTTAPPPPPEFNVHVFDHSSQLDLLTPDFASKMEWAMSTPGRKNISRASGSFPWEDTIEEDNMAMNQD